MDDHKARQDVIETADSVIEALYDLPLGGEWTVLQEALCNYWIALDHNEIDQRESVALLERHFERALKILEQSPSKGSRWRAQLYQIPVPACILNASGDLVDANPLGSARLAGSERDLPRLSARNRALTRDAITQLENRGGKLTELQLELFSGERVKLFLGTLADTRVEHARLYLAVVVNSDLPAEGLDALARQFKLTPAETRLCLQLAAGRSLDELAKQTEVKKTTLRTHLYSCFSKLNVKSQPELVALVLNNLFAINQLTTITREPPKMTRFVEPELHGYPLFRKLSLADGRSIGYFEYGDPDGIPALYLHGSLDCGLFMQRQHLEERGIRFLAVERGGVGESEPNPDPSPEAYARDLTELVDQLKLQEFAVIGRSMGSWDAIAFALSAPHRARLLVLASGRLPVEQRQDHAKHSSFYRSLYNSVWHSPAMGKLMLRGMLLQLRVNGPQRFMPEDGLPEAEIELVHDPLYRRHMTNVWFRSAAFGTGPTNEHLKLYRNPVSNPPWRNCAIPTLLIHGDKDANVPLDSVLAQTATFTNRTVRILPNVGHRLVHLAMGEVLDHVREMWSTLPEKPTATVTATVNNASESR